MKCSECQSFCKIGNTDETGQGLCTLQSSYTPVSLDTQCPFTPEPYKCKDCWRIDNDTACMTCDMEDSAYHDGHLCAGFIDRNVETIRNALYLLKQRDSNYHETIEQLMKEVDALPLPQRKTE